MFEIFHTIFRYKEKQSPDILGKFPSQVHIDAMPERRYLWTSRFLVIFSCMSISLTMMLASAIYVMLPQRSSSPVLLHENEYFNILEYTEKDEKNVAVEDLIAEQFIQQYILLRHVISSDYDEIMNRWRRGSALYWLSSPHVFSNFERSDVQNNLMQFRRRAMTRMVAVQWIRPLTRGLWQAQFVTLDYYAKDKNPKVNIWRAYLRVAFANIPFGNKGDRTLNPFGFLVTNYSLAYVGAPTNPKEFLKNMKSLAGTVSF